MKYALISATSMLFILVAVLSFAAGIWYADRDDDAMQYTVKGEDGDKGSWITITGSVSVAGWPAVEGGDGTKYINLRPVVQEAPVSSPSRQPDTAPNCDGIDCQQNG